MRLLFYLSIGYLINSQKYIIIFILLKIIKQIYYMLNDVFVFVHIVCKYNMHVKELNYYYLLGVQIHIKCNEQCT